MTAEYHKKIFEIQQAISKREMHRMELEKELSRVRNKKETNNEKLRFKLRKLKQEVLDDDRNHRRSVEALLNRIQSQKREYEILQKRTLQIRAKKDHLAFINSLQTSLKSTSMMYSELHWPQIQDSSSQTEPVMMATSKITEGTQITPRIMSYQPAIIYAKDHFYHPEAMLEDPSGFRFNNLPTELQQAEKFGYYVRKDPQPEESYYQLKSNYNTNSLPLFNQKPEIINTVKKDIYSTNRVDEYTQPKQNIDKLSENNESLETFNGATYSEQGFTNKLMKKDTIPSAVFLPQPLRSEETSNHNTLRINRNDAQTTFTDSRQVESVNAEFTTSLPSDRKEKIRDESHLHDQSNENHEDRSTETNSNIESTSTGVKVENVKLKKIVTEPLKLVSFTPPKCKSNDEKTTTDSSMISEVKIQHGKEDKQRMLPEKKGSLAQGIDDGAETPKINQSLRTSSEKNSTDTENSMFAEKNDNSHSDENDSAKKQIVDSIPDSKTINEENKILDSSQPQRETSLETPEAGTHSQGQITEKAEELIVPTDMPKTKEIIRNTEEKKYDYRRDFFDDCTSNKPTDAYKQMLRRISHEPQDIGNDDEDEQRNNRITNPTISELPNYDAESIDSVEAAIQAATRGNYVNPDEPNSPSSNSSRTENNIAASSSRTIDRPDMTKPTPDTPITLGPQIKKPLFAKPVRVNDPLKISLDSDSESLSPVSAGDDPTDNDDSFFS